MKKLNFLHNPASNEQGNALVLALVATVIMTLAGYFINQNSLNTEGQIKGLRMKNEMTLRFTRLMTWISNSSSRNFTGSGDNWLRWSDISPSTIHFVQQGGTGCSPSLLSGSTESWALCLHVTEKTPTKIQGTLHFLSKESLSMKPMDLTYTRSLNSGERGQYTCPPPPAEYALSIITGFANQSGGFLAKCEKHLKGSQDCPTGQYLKSRNSSMEIACGTVPTSRRCTSFNQYIKVYSFQGDVSTQDDLMCENKLDPFSSWSPI